MSKKKSDIVIKKYKNENLADIENMNLKTDEIQLWILRWKELEHWVRQYQKILPEEERAYINRFRNHEDRMRSAVGKILIRKLLAQYMNIPEETVIISKGRYGKPYIDNEVSVQFNISHSGKMVLAAVSGDIIVGIDIEKISQIPEYILLAENYFTVHEWKEIAAADSIELFYDYWTAKEAYVKAVGMGLGKNFRSFRVIGSSVIDHSAWQVPWNRKKIEVSTGYIANIVYMTARFGSGTVPHSIAYMKTWEQEKC